MQVIIPGLLILPLLIKESSLMKKNSLLLVFMAFLAAGVYAAGNTTSSGNESQNASEASSVKSGESAAKLASNDFSIYPIQVVIEKPGQIKTLNVVNSAKYPLFVQANLRNYVQYMNNGKLLESMTDINPPGSKVLVKPSLIVSPIVIKNIPAGKKQIVRVMGIKQESNIEQAYRLTVKNITPISVVRAGTVFEIGYTIPLFILPKNINESYNFQYLKEKNHSYLRLANTGNVHILIKSLNIVVNNKPVKLSIKTVRLLAGSWELIEIPASVAHTLVPGQSLSLEIDREKLSNFEDTVSEKKTVAIN